MQFIKFAREDSKLTSYRYLVQLPSGYKQLIIYGWYGSATKPNINFANASYGEDSGTGAPRYNYIPDKAKNAITGPVSVDFLIFLTKESLFGGDFEWSGVVNYSFHGDNTSDEASSYTYSSFQLFNGYDYLMFGSKDTSDVLTNLTYTMLGIPT